MKPIVTLPGSITERLSNGCKLVIGESPIGESGYIAGLVSENLADNLNAVASTPEGAIAELEMELWKRAAK